MLFMLFLNAFTNILNIPPFSLLTWQTSTDEMHKTEAAWGSRDPGCEGVPRPRHGSTALSQPDADASLRGAPGAQCSSLVLVVSETFTYSEVRTSPIIQ